MDWGLGAGADWETDSGSGWDVDAARDLVVWADAAWAAVMASAVALTAMDSVDQDRAEDFRVRFGHAPPKNRRHIEKTPRLSARLRLVVV
jgi:hypothetical protein